jgi:hypothetical protein
VCQPVQTQANHRAGANHATHAETARPDRPSLPAAAHTLASLQRTRIPSLPAAAHTLASLRQRTRSPLAIAPIAHCRRCSVPVALALAIPVVVAERPSRRPTIHQPRAEQAEPRRSVSRGVVAAALVVPVLLGYRGGHSKLHSVCCWAWAIKA